MEARKKRLEDLNITRDEINNIGQALQKEEFRKLFVEYCEEVNSPESRKQFQSEVTELERQRGVHVTFINPSPGFVIKTSIDGDRKAFINVCKNEKVLPPSSTPSSEDGTQGRRWSLPFSLAPPREDFDKRRNRCTVFDVVFHPETLQLSEKTPEFRKMLINTALDAVENNCKSKLDRTNLKFPKLAFKGLPQAAVVREKIQNHKIQDDDKEFLKQMPYPEDTNIWAHVGTEKVMTEEKKKEPLEHTAPKYSIKYRHGIDLSDFTDDASARLNATVPKELVIVVDLPLLKSAKDLTLDVTHKSLALKCDRPKYKLDLVLPYGVDEELGNANFDTCTRKLILELPVKRNLPSLIDVGREDSGVESDPGGRVDDDSDEKSPSENSDLGSDGNHLSIVQEVPNESGDIPETCGDTALSQDNSNKSMGLLLPNFSLNTMENMVAVVLHVKNVESNSISQNIFPECHGFQLSFSSLGGGMFPQSYGFCMIFPSSVDIEKDSLTVEVWDNNVVAQFAVASLSSPTSEVLIGTGPHDLQSHDINNVAIVEKRIADLKESTENAEPRSPYVEVHSAEEEKLVLKIGPYSSSQSQESGISSVASAVSSPSETSVASTPEGKKDVPLERARRSTPRQLSECSSDDLNGKKIRGILKKRPLRSLSESNADDYALMYHSASLSDEGESGSNSVMGSVSCIGEEGCETGCDTENEGGDRQSKKTVRFNDVVAQQTFRPNSSIFGQRKKNQRKQRNKKRAQERRASESENSEPESELEKARRRACHSEGEASDFEDKHNTKKNTFLKDLKMEQSNPEAKKILRRVSSSDTDEDQVKDCSAVEMNKSVNAVTSAGDCVIQVESSCQTLQPVINHGESSEDERDEKTDDKKKKKKKRKGKKVSAKGDSCKTLMKEVDTEFKSGLILELEM